MKLYHATYAENKESIQKDGIKRFCPQNFDGMCMNDCIYFAFHPEAAIAYAEGADTYEGQEIIVFSVDAEDLDLLCVGYDWNNLCEYENDINSIAYHGDVESRYLSVLTKDEIEKAEEVVFSDLKHLDDRASEIWDIIGNIFDEEVETNKEQEEIEQ